MNTLKKLPALSDLNDPAFNTGVAIPPTIQFLSNLKGFENPGDKKSADYCGMGIRHTEALKAGFTPDETWEPVYIKFGDSSPELTYVCDKPRLLVINKGELLMMDSSFQKFPYDKDVFESNKSDWETFNYFIVFVVNKDKEILSNVPFRLKLRSTIGISFKDRYLGKTGKNSVVGFRDKFLPAYQARLRDTTSSGELFFAGTIYAPTIEPIVATSKTDSSKSSIAAITTGFEEPTYENIGDYYIFPTLDDGSPNPHFAKYRETFEDEKIQAWVKPSPPRKPQPKQAVYNSPADEEESYDYFGDEEYSGGTAVKVKPVVNNEAFLIHVQTRLRQLKTANEIPDKDWGNTVKQIATNALNRIVASTKDIHSQEELDTVVNGFISVYGDNEPPTDAF